MDRLVQAGPDVGRCPIPVQDLESCRHVLERFAQSMAALGPKLTLVGLSRRTTIQEDLRATVELKLAH